jgi:hypothetical protein
VKQFIIINGAMGVGKSYTCKALNKRLMKSVWLDGDWCMMINPLNFTPEITKMFLDNCIHLLKNFLSDPTLDYVIFSWVFPGEDLLNFIVKQVYDASFEVKKISLLCSNVHSHGHPATDCLTLSRRCLESFYRMAANQDARGHFGRNRSCVTAGRSPLEFSQTQ